MTSPQWPPHVHPNTAHAVDDSAPTQEIPVIHPAGVRTLPEPARNVGWRIFVGSSAVVIVVAVGLFTWVVAGTDSAPTPSQVQPSPAAPSATTSVPESPAAAIEPSTIAPVPPGPARSITAREWQLIAKNPDAHIGERVVVHGEVTQFDAATGIGVFRANVDGIVHKPRYGWADYDTNTMLGGGSGLLSDVVQGDLFRAEVTVLGSYTYDTQIGGSTTVPNLGVTAIEVTGHV